MGLLSPAPTVLGACSLTAAVETVCSVHLCVCIFILAQVDSAQSVNVAGVEVSPTFQCITGAWCLLGIPMIIHGGIGAIYTVEGHLTTYMIYLIGTMAVAIGWIVLFLRYGNTCSTLHPTTTDGRSTASFVCGISNGMVIFWMLALLGAIAIGTYLVWSMKEYCKKRLEMELIRYQEPWQVVQALADDIAVEPPRSKPPFIWAYPPAPEPPRPPPPPPAQPQAVVVAVPKGSLGPSRSVADGGQLFQQLDRNRDGQVTVAEAAQGLQVMASVRNLSQDHLKHH